MFGITKPGNPSNRRTGFGTCLKFGIWKLEFGVSNLGFRISNFLNQEGVVPRGGTRGLAVASYLPYYRPSEYSGLRLGKQARDSSFQPWNIATNSST